MKSIFIVLMVCLCAVNSIYAGEKTAVPAAVQTAFNKTYTTASTVKWNKEGEQFEASFLYKKQQMSVLYNADGTAAETETEIDVAKLPPAAGKYAMQRGKIMEAAKIVLADGSVMYEAEVGKKDLLFDEKGKFLKEKTDRE